MDPIDLLTVSAYMTYKLSLCATATTTGRDFFNEIKNPEIGDLVMEISTLGRRDNKTAIGKLVKIEQAAICSKKEWKESRESGAIPTEKRFTIETLYASGPKRVHWTNCTFIKVFDGYRGY